MENKPTHPTAGNVLLCIRASISAVDVLYVSQEMKRLTSSLSSIVILITSCMGGQKDHPKPDATKNLRDTIKNSAQVCVFEGLPHPMFESELLKIEKKRKDATMVASYPFYTPKVQVEEVAASKLKAIISDSSNYIQFSGEKRCGGFHPDYAVEWSDGDIRYSALFCYGCGEVLVVDGKNTYRYDFKISDDLKKIFASFNAKRPKQKEG